LKEVLKQIYNLAIHKQDSARHKSLSLLPIKSMSVCFVPAGIESGFGYLILCLLKARSVL